MNQGALSKFIEKAADEAVSNIDRMMKARETMGKTQYDVDNIKGTCGELAALLCIKVKNDSITSAEGCIEPLARDLLENDKMEVAAKADHDEAEAIQSADFRLAAMALAEALGINRQLSVKLAELKQPSQAHRQA